MSAISTVERRLRERGGTVGRWAEVASEVRQRAQEDRVTIVAAGLAFYGFISVIPAVVATAAIYSLVRDPATLSRQVEGWTREMPFEVQRLVVGSLLDVANLSGTGFGFAIVGAILVTFWASSRAGKALMQSLNVVHGIEEDRDALHRRGIAVAGAVTLIVLASVGFGFVDMVPKLVDAAWWRVLVTVFSWLTVLVVVAAVAALAYRHGPNRPDAQVRWRSPGVLVATGVFAVASTGLFVYITLVGSSAIYGSLGLPLAFAIWLAVVSWGLLIGAYVNVVMTGEEGTGEHGV